MQNVGMRLRALTPAVHGPDSHCNFYLRIRHFCPLFLSHPAAPLCALRQSPTTSPDLCLIFLKNNNNNKKGGSPLVKKPRESRPRGVHVRLLLFYLNPSASAFCARPALCCGPRQHPQRHLPELGAALLWQAADDAASHRGSALTHRAARWRRAGGAGRGREQLISTDL